MNVKKLLGILLLVVLFSCERDGVNASKNQFVYTLDGKKQNVKGLYAYAVDFSNTVNAYGIIDGDTDYPKTLYISFKKGLGSGTYSNEDDVFALYTDEKDTYRTDYFGGSITAELKNVNAEELIGSFSFTATDNNGKAITVKDGSFNVRFR